jgi:hypothetical protein
LNHLILPIGASLNQEYDFSGDKSPIPTYLPKTFRKFKNLSHITSINLSFTLGMFLRLDGPSGGLYMLGTWAGADFSPEIVDRRVLRSLAQFRISTVERLAITHYNALPPGKVEKSPGYLTFILMNSLRTLILIGCPNLSFILALNPKKNPTGTVVCPELEELVLYIPNKDWFCINPLLETMRERASSGAKLSILMIVGSEEFVPAKEVLKLRNHVSRVEYRLDDVVPGWDVIPDDVNSTYESDWSD